jgi:peptidoglycan-associated lipoprotein
MRTESFSVRSLTTVAALAVVALGCGVKRGDLNSELTTLRQEMESRDEALGNRIDERNNALSGQIGSFEQRMRGLEQELQSLRSEFDTRITQIQASLRFDAPVHFGYDSDELREEDKPLLNRFASVVNQYYPNATVTVEGFTDPAGSREYNLALGRRRADAVRAYLSSQGGVEASRVKAVSYGESKDRQMQPGAWGENGLANRRVALVIDYMGGERSAMTTSSN